MLDLLKIEWLKLKNYKAFLIIGIFFILGIFITNYMVLTVFNKMVDKTEAGMLLGKFMPYDFKHVWQTTSYASGYILILPVMLLIMLVTNEFTYKTSRQNIIDGISRLDFIHVKIILATLFAIISTLFVIVTGFALASTTGTEFSFHGFSQVGYFFLKAITYNFIAVFISVLIKRTGFAIGVYFIYMSAENIISQLLDVWSMKIKVESKLDLGSLGSYLPMNASDSLLSFPENPFKSMAKNAFPTDYHYLTISIAVFFVVLFYWLSRSIILKKDL